MVRIVKADTTLMERPARARSAASRQLTPAQVERQKQQRQFSRMIGRLSDPSVVFEIRLNRDDKAVTIRQRLIRAAQDAGKEVAVRKSKNGFAVGLMTPERRSNRGRKKSSAS